MNIYVDVYLGGFTMHICMFVHAYGYGTAHIFIHTRQFAFCSAASYAKRHQLTYVEEQYAQDGSMYFILSTV